MQSFFQVLSLDPAWIAHGAEGGDIFAGSYSGLALLRSWTSLSPALS